MRKVLSLVLAVTVFVLLTASIIGLLVAGTVALWPGASHAGRLAAVSGDFFILGLCGCGLGVYFFGND